MKQICRATVRGAGNASIVHGLRMRASPCRARQLGRRSPALQSFVTLSRHCRNFNPFFLTGRRIFCQNVHEENEQTARNETRWHHLRPAGAGFLRKYFASRRRGRATSAKAKNNESELNYEKSENYIWDGPVCGCLLWALPTSAKR